MNTRGSLAPTVPTIQLNWREQMCNKEDIEQYDGYERRVAEEMNDKGKKIGNEDRGPKESTQHRQKKSVRYRHRMNPSKKAA